MTAPVPETSARTTGSPPAFEMVGGCVEFDGVHVFNHLDLSIEPGSFLALLGPNGSGKTTLVRALLGLQPLSHGLIRIEGVPLAGYRHWERIGFVPQRLPAATGVPVSVAELVGSGQIHPRTRLRRRTPEQHAAVTAALESVGLTERMHHRVDALSGGQQRRVMLARALAGGARTLVLDEPMAGVDLANQQRIAEILRQLPAGSTVILVAHGLGPVVDLVTRAIVLDRGRVVHDGPRAPAGWVDHHGDDDVPDDPTLMAG